MIRKPEGFDVLDITRLSAKWRIVETFPLGFSAAIAPGRDGVGHSLQFMNTGFGEVNLIADLDEQPLWAVSMSAQLFGYSAFTGPVTFWRWAHPSAGAAGELAVDMGTHQLSVLNNGVVVAVGPVLPSEPAWTSIDLVCDYAGNNVKLYMDDVLIINSGVSWHTGIYHPSQAKLRWESFGFFGIRIDDLVISDGQGSRNVGRVGPVGVRVSRPLTDGIPPAWLRNAGASDAAAAGDGNWSTTLTGAAGDLDLFAIEEFACDGLILAAAPAAAASGSGTLEMLARLDPTTVAETSFGAIAVPTSLGVLQPILEVSPATGVNWTAGELSEAFWGMRPGAGTVVVPEFWIEKVYSRRDVPFDCGKLGSYAY